LKDIKALRIKPIKCRKKKNFRKRGGKKELIKKNN